MSKAPEVRTLQRFDVNNFDLSKQNYRLQYTIMLVLALVSFLGCIIFIIIGHVTFGKLTEDEIKQLKKIEDDDPES